MPESYEGYLEKGTITPTRPLTKFRGRRRVIITVMDEATPAPEETEQAKAWREFFEAVNASNEEVPEAFERVNFTQETISDFLCHAKEYVEESDSVVDLAKDIVLE